MVAESGSFIVAKIDPVDGRNSVELGLGTEQLAQLEQWLDQNGTNWVVVLMESAGGETFTDAQGRRFNGMEAVEHRLGNGLPGRTSFGTWTDPRTGERNGAFFALFLKDRKFSYYGSDAQDKRGLGEDRWVGRLDQPAIAAMRSGGRIIDAAKDTVASINKQLDQRIASEETQRRQAAAGMEARNARLKSSASGLLEIAQQNIDHHESEIVGLRRMQPELTGLVVQPDFVSWKADLASAKSNFESGEFQAASTLAASVNESVARASRELVAYQNVEPRIARLQAEVAALRKDPYAKTIGHAFDDAEQSLTEAKRLHETADPLYQGRLETALKDVRFIKDTISSKARRDKLRSEVLTLAVSLASGVFLLGALVLNRRRRPSRREALELIEAWTRALDEKTVSASALMGRSMNALGVSRTEAEARFAGDTLVLVKQTIRDMDEMLIMAACAGRVLKEARSLARPEAVSRRATNLFFKRHYRAAIRRLRDEPVVFEPEEGLADALRDKQTDRDRLLGDLDSYQPFKLSFNELIANFNQRAERALTALDELAEGQLKMADLLVEVEQGIEKTRQDATTFENQIGPDVLFPITATLATLLPSATDAFSAAAVMSIGDPLCALRTVGARAREQSDDAREVVRLATDFHDRIKQEIVPVREELINLDLTTDWIDEVLRQLSGAFVGATRRAAIASTAESIADIVTGLAAVVKRVGLTVKAEQFRGETVLPAIAETTGFVATSRAQMGQQLGLDSGRILVEEGRDPDHFLKASREQSEAARAASNRGDVDGANSASARALHDAGLGRQLVDGTATAFAQYDDTLKARTAEANRLESAIPSHQAILKSIESRYAATVLLLGAGDSTHPDANGTSRDNLKESHNLMANATNYLKNAVDWFARGWILDSAGTLERAEGCQKLVKSRLQEVRDKQDRLSKTETANRSLLRLLCIRVDHFESQMKDNRTTHETPPFLSS